MQKFSPCRFDREKKFCSFLWDGDEGKEEEPGVEERSEKVWGERGKVGVAE